MTRATLLLAALVVGCGSSPPPAQRATTSSSGDGQPAGRTDAGRAPSPPDAALEAGANESTDRDGDVPSRCSARRSPHCVGPSCGASSSARSRPLETFQGRVSYYADSLHGRRTASGEPYDRNALTAASRSLPFGALVRVRRADDPSKVVIVRVNDRGPSARGGRVLDLSRAAAECLDMIRRGVVEVRADVLDWGPRGRSGR